MLSNKFKALSLFLVCFNAFALTEIPAGKIQIEGKVSIEDDQTYLVMNPGTLSQSKLLLLGDSNLLRNQNNANARLEVELEKKMMGSRGEVKLLKLIRFLHPAEDLRVYNETSDFNP